jgi:hypothetical protein
LNWDLLEVKGGGESDEDTEEPDDDEIWARECVHRTRYLNSFIATNICRHTLRGTLADEYRRAVL